MGDFNNDKFLSLMARVSRLEEEITYNRRDEQIEELFKQVAAISSDINSHSSMINSALKTALIVIGISFSLASGFWIYHSSQTTQIENEILKNNKVMHSTNE